MDLYKLKFDGIYDSRTLRELKQGGIEHFNFDFNPRSLNFIQERIFLNLLETILNETDKIFLHFTSNRDFMAIKIYEEILKRRGSLHNVFFEFDDFFVDIVLPEKMNYYLLYRPSIFLFQKNSDNFTGFIFSHELLAKVNNDSNLVPFYSNFFTHFQSYDLDSKKFIIKLGMNEVVNDKCMDIFDFNIVSFVLTSEVEICYRNMDLKKLKSTVDSKIKIFKPQAHL